MVDVLLIEDSAEKRDEIKAEVATFFGTTLRKIDLCDTFSDAAKAILEKSTTSL